MVTIPIAEKQASDQQQFDLAYQGLAAQYPQATAPVPGYQGPALTSLLATAPQPTAQVADDPNLSVASVQPAPASAPTPVGADIAAPTAQAPAQHALDAHYQTLAAQYPPPTRAPDNVPDTAQPAAPASNDLGLGFAPPTRAPDNQPDTSPSAVLPGLPGPQRAPDDTPPLPNLAPAPDGSSGGTGSTWTGQADIPDQFHSGLSAADAMAACGPVAALAFARAHGRNPTLSEAMSIARQIGWTPAAGMGGVGNEKRLLDALDVPAILDQGASWANIQHQVQGGSLAIISTPGHYFVADDFDPQTGAYHVGQSGLAYRRGSPWMTPDQMQNLAGTVNGALYTSASSDEAAASGGTLGDSATSGPKQWTAQESAAVQPFSDEPDLNQAYQQAQRSNAQAAWAREADARMPSSGALDQVALDQAQAAAGREAQGRMPSAGAVDRVAQGNAYQQMQADTLGHLHPPAGPVFSQPPVQTTTPGPQIINPPPLQLGGSGAPKPAPINMPTAAAYMPGGQVEPGSPLGQVARGGTLSSAGQVAMVPQLLDQVFRVVNEVGAGSGSEPNTRPDFGALLPGGADTHAADEGAQAVARVGAAVTRDPEADAAALRRTLGYAPVELNAGPTPQAVGRTVRDAFAPALNAPQSTQDALNAMDSTIRGTAASLDTAARAGSITRDEQAVLSGWSRQTAQSEFVAAVKASGDGVLPTMQNGAAVARPDGWVPGIKVDAGLVGTWVSPEVATVVRNTLQSGTTIPGLEGMARVTGAVKETILSGSPFHSLQEELQAVRVNREASGPVIGQSLLNAANPSAYNRFRSAWAPWFERAAAAGMTQLVDPLEGEGRDLLKGVSGAAIRGTIGGVGSGVSTFAADKAQGQSDQQAFMDALGKGALGAAGAGLVGSAIGPALWERQIPTLKVMTFKTLVGRGMSDEAAATVVNQTFGGLNLTRIARSPDVTAALRAVTLAPDWWESWGRQLGGVLRPGEVGSASRQYVATTVVSAAATLEGLNYALSGHFTNENDAGHQLDLDVTGITQGTNAKGQGQHVYLDVLGPIRSILQPALAEDPGAFVKARESLPVSFAQSAVTNKDFRGQAIVPPGTDPLHSAADLAGYEVGQMAPAGASGLVSAYQAGGPVGAALSGATGLRVSAESDAQATTKAEAPALADYVKQSAAYQNAKTETARQTILANEVPRLQAGVAETRAELPEDQAGLLLTHGMTLAAPPASVSLGKGATSIALSKDERTQYAKLRGQALQRDLATLKADKDFQAAAPAEQLAALRKVVTAADTEARGGVLEGLSQADLSRRAQEAVNQGPKTRAPLPVASPSFVAPRASPSPVGASR